MRQINDLHRSIDGLSGNLAETRSELTHINDDKRTAEQKLDDFAYQNGSM
jgi:hypothetical protein